MVLDNSFDQHPPGSDRGLTPNDPKSKSNESFKQELAVIHVDNYFKFYYLHVIYYTTLGPIFFLLFFWITWVRASLKNLLFIRLNPWCLYQNLYWSTCAIVLIFAVILNNSGYRYTTLDAALLYSTLLNTFFRSATISGKYATYPRAEVDRILGQKVDSSTVVNEMMINAWRKQDYDTVVSEITNVDTTYDFERHPAIVVNEHSMFVNELLKILAIAYNTQRFAPLVPNIILFTGAFVRAIAHGLLNLAVGIRFHGDTTEEAILFYYIAIFQFMYFTVGPLFYLLLYIDINRQRVLTQNAIQILSDKPLIDIDNTKVRTTEQDDIVAITILIKKLDKYGYRFIQRHKCLMGFIILHTLFLVLSLFPFYFEIFDYTKTPSTQAKLQCLMLIDLCLLTLASIIGMTLILLTNKDKRRLRTMINQPSLPLISEITILGVIPNLSIAIVTWASMLAGVAGGFYLVFAGKYKLFRYQY